MSSAVAPHRSIRPRKARVKLKLLDLVGSGDRIAAFVLPWAIVGLLVQTFYPHALRVGAPALVRLLVSAALAIPGLAGWIGSVVLLLTRARGGELITTGPYAWVKHPLYTSVALLVLPAIGFAFDSWLGVALGAVLYLASRLYSPDEEKELLETFGAEWEAYCRNVKIPWL